MSRGLHAFHRARFFTSAITFKNRSFICASNSFTSMSLPVHGTNPPAIDAWPPPLPIPFSASATIFPASSILFSLRTESLIPGYYQDWDGPEEGERPAAYIILLSPAGVNAPQDEGIIGQTILLSATEEGMGGCFIANVDRAGLAEAIQVPEGYQIKLVIALGYPKEEVVIDEITKDGDIKYYRDSKQTHHVPKIKLEDLIIK